MQSAAEYPLERTWVIWEMWSTKEFSNYTSNMNAVGTFGTMWDFLQHWENLPHSTPNFYFSNFKDSTERRIEGVPTAIEAIGVFAQGVRPAWEDPVNEKGSDLNFRKLMEEGSIKDIWKRLVFSLVGETFPGSEDVVGVRIVDKSKNFKCEIWLNFNIELFPEKLQVFKEWISQNLGIGSNEVFTGIHETKSKKA